MNGSILISRSIIESEIWRKPPLYLKVWMYLLIKAQYKPYKGLNRGELFVSIKEIQEACCSYSGYRREMPSKDQIFRILNWLRNTGSEQNNADSEHSDLRASDGHNHGRNDNATTGATMITTTKATHGMVINIVNYGKYQTLKQYESNDEPDNGRDSEKDADEQRARSRRDNINEEREERIYLSSTSARAREDECKRLFDLFSKTTSAENANPLAAQGIDDWVDIIGAQVVEYAIQFVKEKRGGNKPWGYVETILRDWDMRGLKSVEALKEQFEQTHKGVQSSEGDYSSGSAGFIPSTGFKKPEDFM